MTTINRIQALRLIESNTSTFYSLSFVKKDGSIREMNCRNNVKKYVKGTTPEITEKRKETLHANGMKTVFDMQKNAYRTINFNTVFRLCMNGSVYTVE